MQARGWSAYTSKGSTKADVLASCLYASAAECFPAGIKIRSDWSDKDPDWEENFYILQKTKCPAVLTENFFRIIRKMLNSYFPLMGKREL